MSEQGTFPQSEDDSSTYEMDRSESVCDAVASAVAAIPGYEPTPPTTANGAPGVLDPLYKAVDPDALETLFRGPGDGKLGGDCRVDFVLNEYHVTVHGDGRIRAHPDATPLAEQ